MPQDDRLVMAEAIREHFLYGTFTLSQLGVPNATAIDAAASGGGGGLSEAQVDARVVAGITGKLDTTHTHAIADTTGLQAAIDGKQAAGSYAAASHTHAQADVTGLVTALSGKAATAHTHAIADTTGLQAALDGKQTAGSYAASSHTHTKSAITDFAHTHPQSEVTNLVTDLAAKSATGHTHTKAEIEAVLTGVISSHSHSGGGSDPWTHLFLAADFTTSSATAVDVTGLAFTPVANTRYIVEGQLLVRTATTTVGPRPGIAWPTGLTDGIARMDVTSSATAQLTTNGNISAALLCAVGGLPTTTGSFPAQISATFLAGASPSGTFKIQLASETAATNVIAKAGSWIRYRIL